MLMVMRLCVLGSCLLVLAVGSGCEGTSGEAVTVTSTAGPVDSATTGPGQFSSPVTIDGPWELVSLVSEGEQVPLGDWPGPSPPWIRFEPSVQGWTGCNSFSSFGEPGYTVAGGVLRFEEIVIENAGCEGRESEVEAILIGFLWDDRGVAVGFDGDHMVWTRQGGEAEAVFAASD